MPTRSDFRRLALRRLTGDRLGVVYALLAVAELLVLLLAWQSGRAYNRQRQLVERNLVEFARFGATNFAYRAGALVANHAAMVSESVARGELSDFTRLARARAALDSIAACRCEAALHVTSVHLLNRDGQLVAPSPPITTPVAPGVLSSLLARASSDAPAVRATDESGAPMFLAMTRAGMGPPGAERFLLTVYDVDSVRKKVFGFIYNTRPTLLPSVFGARRSNEDVIAVRVVLSGGTVLYESPSHSTWTSIAWVPFGPDTATRVQASLTLAAARELTGVIDDGMRRWWGLFTAFGATLVIGLTALLVHRVAALTKLRGEFTATVSHELRTPLTEIMLYAELIVTGRTSGSTPTTEAAQVILAEAKRLHNLVENVLIVARTDRRMLRVRIGSHAPVPLLQTIIAGFTPIAAKRRSRVILEADDLPNVLCDPSAVAGVLLNLLDNAVRYGRHDQDVIVRATRATDTSLVIDVDDTGPGIPHAERARVLEPYVRLERDTESSAGGSGLGLAVVVALLTEMHGTLTILDSTRGGTCMRVTLPLG